MMKLLSSRGSGVDLNFRSVTCKYEEFSDKLSVPKRTTKSEGTPHI